MLFILKERVSKISLQIIQLRCNWSRSRIDLQLDQLTTNLNRNFFRYRTRKFIHQRKEMLFFISYLSLGGIFLILHQ